MKTMRSLGAVVLGISTYRYAAAVDTAPPLQYAVDDAEAFVRYLRTCWPSTNDAEVYLIEEAKHAAFNSAPRWEQRFVALGRLRLLPSFPCWLVSR